MDRRRRSRICILLPASTISHGTVYGLAMPLILIPAHTAQPPPSTLQSHPDWPSTSTHPLWITHRSHPSTLHSVPPHATICPAYRIIADSRGHGPNPWKLSIDPYVMPPMPPLTSASARAGSGEVCRSLGSIHSTTKDACLAFLGCISPPRIVFSSHTKHCIHIRTQHPAFRSTCINRIENNAPRTTTKTTHVHREYRLPRRRLIRRHYPLPHPTPNRCRTPSLPP